MDMQTLQIPAHIWRTVEAVFPLGAEGDANELAIFLLGVATGVELKQRVLEQERQRQAMLARST